MLLSDYFHNLEIEYLMYLFMFFFRHDSADLRAHAAQIATVQIGIHVEDRPDVVMVHDHRRVTTLYAYQIGEQLRAAAHRARVSVCLRTAAGRRGDEALVAVSDEALPSRPRL